ncbi:MULTISPECIES: SGNH/GDSL hydrolase family protein [Bacillus]|uniref:EPSX protein n=1 Tax=Bacillus thuringiensis TaxID=1428 RepID=A0A9X6KFK9_BACTU|nr:MULTISPECIES: SGNH/GDSL hydrolase family protein [Bacillus]KUF27091.1 EPSX protein [Bacillus sp. G3(2015)]MDA2612929.1 SGNH/GDSL hydrolase family protein [Bacillus cereus]MDR5045039.1 SGNH/GDSL hydrolase family protein [Bacillus thuringiensis]MEB8555477.1 SGNH/GDSL hydrolase family protein [Bacillus cereus]MEB8651940.1 SGNH/GDSL hydrolase family protein [Bacillus cereus]
MNKKAVLVLVIFVLFVASIVSGKLYWNQKIANATGQTSEVTKTKDEVKDSGAKKEEKKEEKKQDAKSSFNEAYAKNLPDAVKEKLKKAAEDKKAVNLVIVGDEASSSEKSAWAAKLTANLETAYGKGLWNVTVKEYKGESTEELITNKRDKEIGKENPDVILFEPPFITDNGKTGNGNSVVNTQKFVQALSTSAKGATIMIQPSNPVYGAKNYPKSIEALKQFATQNNYTYIDHWGAWPDATTKAILPYLQEEFGFPNAKGHDVWAQYVTDYFIAK